MTQQIDSAFRERFWYTETLRVNDARDDYQRDRSRIIHSSAFRRLQAKTQVMGVGEGDFHRTRLTHSIEAAQISESMLLVLLRNYTNDECVTLWLPPRDLLTAACLAHDLGHPPFGHGGETALHKRMIDGGGFEGNAQTLRIITRLEKYTKNKGMNPTRRTILSILKYPSAYSSFDKTEIKDKPPKCYYDTEKDIVDWALREDFQPEEISIFTSEKTKGKPKHRTLDSSIMELADDIAYAVHDLEDIVARGLVGQEELMDHLQTIFAKHNGNIGTNGETISEADFKSLFADSDVRKQFVGKLVNLFVTSVHVKEKKEFEHPLLKYYVRYDGPVGELLEELKYLTYDLVISRPAIQQLERRGQRMIGSLFDEFMQAPEELIPTSTWSSYLEEDDSKRKVCDYIAGMTDSYAEKVYGRFFTPGEGSSTDEL